MVIVRGRSLLLMLTAYQFKVKERSPLIVVFTSILLTLNTFLHRSYAFYLTNLQVELGKANSVFQWLVGDKYKVKTA